MHKIIILILSLSSISIFAMEANSNQVANDLIESEGSKLKNINQGNWEVGGNLGIGYSSISGTIIDTNPRFQYFFIKNLSFGATVEYDRSSKSERISIGPSMSYYFWESGKWATYFGQNIVWSKYSGNYLNGSSKAIGQSSIGVNYFVFPSVALGFNLKNAYALDSGYFDDHFVLKGEFLVYF